MVLLWLLSSSFLGELLPLLIPGDNFLVFRSYDLGFFSSLKKGSLFL